ISPRRSPTAPSARARTHSQSITALGLYLRRSRTFARRDRSERPERVSGAGPRGGGGEARDGSRSVPSEAGEGEASRWPVGRGRALCGGWWGALAEGLNEVAEALVVHAGVVEEIHLHHRGLLAGAQALLFVQREQPVL